MTLRETLQLRGSKDEVSYGANELVRRFRWLRCDNAQLKPEVFSLISDWEPMNDVRNLLKLDLV